MKVRVLFFGTLKDVLGRAGDQVELPEGATLADLLARYEAGSPRLRELLPSVALSINQEYASPAARLRHDDEVALLPPVSGGRENHEMQQTEHSALLRAPIDAAFFSERIRRGEDGALAVFEGIVRDHSRGRSTLYLDYEAYEPMALAEMEALAQQALERFAIRDVALVHRLGRLEIGETSVLVVVAAAHRAPAFDACRWLIDTLKKTVPIWKKEYFQDGAVWAPGEPFPEEIATAAPVARPPRRGSGGGSP